MLQPGAPARPDVGLGLPVNLGGRLNIESLLKTLNENTQRDDVKLSALKEIWTMFDIHSNSPMYAHVLESLYRAFIAQLFVQTNPQFIQENNTQQLRKLMLEIMLRTSSHEIAKKCTNEVQKLMLRLIREENEENGCLALKILIDHIKTFRIHNEALPVLDVTSVLQHFRTVFFDMHKHVSNPKMFEQLKIRRPTQPMKEEILIASYLQTCFYSQKVTLNDSNGRPPGPQPEPEYVLIPRASQSVKMLAEIPMLFVLIFNQYKHQIGTEMSEMMKAMVSFINLTVPSSPMGGRDPPEPEDSINRELADDCFNCQIKSLSFMAYIAKQTPDVVFASSQQLLSGIFNLLECCPAEMVQARRELLMAVKFFYTSDFRDKFRPYVARLFSEKLMIGTGYTCQDTIRPMMYSINADLLHHLRLLLPYQILCHTIFVYSRCVHDVSLPANLQSMCVRLMMNLCEAFGKLEKEKGEPGRDLLFHILETCNMKLKILAYYHLPLLFKQHGGGLEWSPDEGSAFKERPEDGVLPSTSGGSNEDKLLDELMTSACDLGDARSRRPSLDTVPELESSRVHEADPVLKGRAAPTNQPPLRSPPAARITPLEDILNSVWGIPAPPLSLVDCRNMIKFLIQCAKYVVAQLIESNLKRTTKSMTFGEERDVFVRFFKYGIICLDVYMLPTQSQARSTGAVRSKDEKDSLDSFANVFTQLNIDVFQEIFSAHMDFLIERISRNYALQLICNSFLVNPETSARFGGILVNYLLQRLPQMSVNSHRSSLYLKLYKLMFSAVSCAQSTGCVDIEKMLKPYMHDMVSDAVRLALNSREPQNYFLLLRALFRSIGGGAHDMLYVQFLPLLPDLLKKLNRLQSCAHRQAMRELFTELCLTIPVRLSSLLPYLPLLMNPLVSALNGSSSLMQQGLRTLELCVDNLQPDYLYEHMAPVRAQLMQGLWKTVSSASDLQSAMTALKILGKLGGSNRKMLVEPQKLKVLKEDELGDGYVVIEVDGRSEGGKPTDEGIFVQTATSQRLHVRLPLQQALSIAADQLRNGLTSELVINQAAILLVRQRAAELARSVLLCGLAPNDYLDLTTSLLEEVKKALQRINKVSFGPVFRCERTALRQIYVDALTVLFFAIVGKDLRKEYIKFFNAVVKYLTIQSLLEQIGGDELGCVHPVGSCMDSSILVDVLIVALSDLNKEFVNAAIVALRHIIDTLRVLIDNESILVSLPFLKQMLERICELCYEESWFARLGGASALHYLIENYPPALISANLSVVIRSLLETHLGLQDEVSSGTIDMALSGLQLVPKTCIPNFNESNERDARVAATLVTEYSRHLFNPDKAFRTQIYSLLLALSSHTGIPPERLFAPVRLQLEAALTNACERFGGNSMHAQMATMEAFSLLVGGEKPIVDLSINVSWLNSFLERIIWICGSTEAGLLDDALYRPLGPPSHHPHDLFHRIVPLRQAATECLVSCYTLLSRNGSPSPQNDSDSRMGYENGEMDRRPQSEELLRLSLKLLGDKQERVQLTARDALAKTIQHRPLPMDLLEEARNQVLDQLDASITDNALRQLYHLAHIDKSLIEERCTKTIMKYLNQLNAEQNNEENGEKNENLPSEMHKLFTICQLFSKSALFDVSFVGPLCSYMATVDYEYTIDRPLNWERTALAFLCRFPTETLHYFITKESVSNPGRRALLRRFIKEPDAVALRSAATSSEIFFFNMLQGRMIDEWKDGKGEWLSPITPPTEQLCSEFELLTLTLIDRCSREDMRWFADAFRLIEQMRELWTSPEFKFRHLVKSDSWSPPIAENQEDLESQGDSVDRERIHVQILHLTKYKVPKLMVTCMLRYLRSNYMHIDLLFDVMNCFVGNYVTDFTFVRQFLESEVIPKYSVEWVRTAFFKVMDRLLEEPEVTMKNLVWVKVIQYVIIPCLQYVIERYDVDVVVGPMCLPQAPNSTTVPDESSMDTEDAEKSQLNMVARLEKVMNECRKSMSARMTVVIFQLATVFVQHAPHHIHDNASKKQGNRLRSLMLLGWPYLNQPTQDITIKYSAHLFLAYIIEKFTINRKIVLQVYHSLMSAYHIDNRDVVKKAIDVITPAVPIRMDDGYFQLLTAVKKILAEEAHNCTHAYHCIFMVCRNYRVFYHVRHELLPSLLGTLNRLYQQLGANFADGRRLVVEVCEMAIKWDLLRNQKLQEIEKGAMNTLPTDNNDEVEGVLEKLKGDRETREEERQQQLKKEEHNSNTGESMDGMQMRKEKEHQPLAKEHVEHVVSLLLKLAIQPPTVQQANQQQVVIELNKRSIALLRAALKPQLWGSTASIKVTWLERQIQSYIEGHRAENNQAQAANAAHVLDVLVTLIQIMPAPLVVQTIQSLQNAIITCMLSGNNQVVRAVNVLVKALLEKTSSSENGLDDFPNLNQEMHKYLFNQLYHYDRTPTANIQSIYTGFSLLRIIGQHQRDYIKTRISLATYARVLLKLGKEHWMYVQQKVDTKEKGGMPELLYVALELLRPHIAELPDDLRRNMIILFAQHVERTDSEKVVEASLKMLHEIVLFYGDTLPNPGVSAFVRITPIIERRFRDNQPLMRQFLASLLMIFSFSAVRKSPEAERLYPAFYWGLTYPDETVRSEFLRVWEQDRDTNIIQRLHYIFCEHNWSSMRDFAWLKHVIFLMLKCVRKPGYGKRVHHDEIGFVTLWNTLTKSIGFASTSVNREIAGIESMQIDSAHKLTEVKKEPMDENSEVAENEADGPIAQKAALFAEMKSLLSEAARHDMADSIDTFVSLIFNVNDNSFVASVFSSLFTSLWACLSSQDRANLENVLISFLCSGRHAIPQVPGNPSMLAVLLDIFSQCGMRIEASIINYIANRHGAWHRGIILLEGMAEHLPRLASSSPHLQFTQNESVQSEILKSMNILDFLDDLYERLSESDQRGVVWERRALLPHTNHALNLFQKGKFEEVHHYIETNNDMWLDRLNQMTPESYNQCTLHWKKEQDFLMEIWKKSLMELSRWEELDQYGKETKDAELLLRVSPHLADWPMLSECVIQIGGCVPRDFVIPYTLHSALLTVVQPDIQQRESPHDFASRCVEEVQRTLIEEWRVLPSIVDLSHISLLQAMNSVQEIHEAAPVMLGISMSQQSTTLSAVHQTVIADVKNIVKTWRNRVGAVSDSLSCLINSQHFRLNVHAEVVKAFDTWEKKGLMQASFASQQMLPIHSSAQGQLIIATAARKRKAFDLSENSLHKLHTLLSLPLIDAQAKVLEELKLYEDKAADPKTDPSFSRQLLVHALAICEKAPLTEGVSKESLCKIFTQKATIMSTLGRSEDAERIFSIAAQLQEPNNTTNGVSAYKAWGKHLDEIFHQRRTPESALREGLFAIVCFMDAARIDNEKKAAKSIARLLFTLKTIEGCGDDKVRDQLDEEIRRHAQGVVPANWLQWLPALCECIRQRPSSAVFAILTKVASAHPQQTFYAIRSLLPIEAVNRVTSNALAPGCTRIEPTASATLLADMNLPEWQMKLVHILDIVLELRPSGLRCLHTILGCLSSLPEFWVERHLREALDIIDIIKRQLGKFRFTGVATVTSSATIAQKASAWSYLVKDLKQQYLEESAAEWPVSQEPLSESEPRFREQMSVKIVQLCDNLSDPIAPLLPQLSAVNSIKNALLRRMKSLPSSILLGDISPWLADFSSRTADVETFPDLFTTRQVQYQSMIARFGARIYVEMRGSRPIRRVEVRAHTGKKSVWLHKREGINRCLDPDENQRSFIQPQIDTSIPRLSLFYSHFYQILQKEPEACKRFLRLFLPIRVEVSSGCSMVEVPNAFSTLVHPIDVMAEKIREVFMEPDEMVDFFYSGVRNSVESVEPSQLEDGHQAERTHTAMLQQFLEQCSSMVREDFLYQHIALRVPDPTHFYTLRKQLSQQLGVISVLEATLGVGPFWLEDMFMCISSCQLWHSSARLELREPTAIPTAPALRFTPNLQKFVGFGRDGHMRWAMEAAMKCLLHDSAQPFMRIMFFDEVASQNQGADLQQAAAILQRVTKNIQKLSSSESAQTREDMHSCLLTAAHPNTLSRADPAWHPWF
ncbi:unnamed protein product, partial [Mesorhabditis belari]|uniref:PI3K/PI4K catalytic domain-containing protein n=1 Tax=Mesorhabditis belari TaxID=2138241 RepID=A0AAF3E8I9_9BILA